MRKLLFSCCVAVFASAAMGAPATAPESNSQATPTAATAGVPVVDAKPQPAVEKKICKSLEVGFSHRTERVCMTAKQWEEYNRGD
ncbi:MAG TPA: hypothetical protein VJP82_00030 [Sphingomicrobium sp.]|jgi:hypothetical protein|nr:hypothetical protein [Sphingomicrobium sp.]